MSAPPGSPPPSAASPPPPYAEATRDSPPPPPSYVSDALPAPPPVSVVETVTGMAASFLGTARRASGSISSSSAPPPPPSPPPGAAHARPIRQRTHFVIQQVPGPTVRYEAMVQAGAAALRSSQGHLRLNETDDMTSMGVYADEQAAVCAAEAFAPPVWDADESASGCARCSAVFNFTRRRHHCRNCGHVYCDSCTLSRWPPGMLPQSFPRGASTRRAAPCRVCDGCNEAVEGFFSALKSGDVLAATEVFSSNTINIHNALVVYPDAPFPVHAAAQGGCFELLAWLVEHRRVSLNVKDAHGRTPLAIAARGGHVEVCRWLVASHGRLCSEVAYDDLCALTTKVLTTTALAADGPGAGAEPYSPSAVDVGGAESFGAQECCVCLDAVADAVFVPCGHFACCFACGSRLDACPVCRRAKTQVVRAFRP